MRMRARRSALRVEGLESRQLLASFFVATSGSDSNLGTAASPFATIQKAVDSVQPGDVVQVSAGSYSGFRLGTSGTSSAPITVAAAPGAKVVIDRPGPNNVHGSNIEVESFSGDVNYVTIANFEVTAAATAGIDVRNGDFNSVVDCYVHDNRVWGIFTAFTDDLTISRNRVSGSVEQHGLYISNSSNRGRITFNEVSGNNDSGIQINADASQGGDGISSGFLIMGNYIHDNGTGGGAALNFDGLQNSSVLGNILSNNHATGIALFRQDASAGSSGNSILSNVIQMAPDSRWAIDINNGSTGNMILANIIQVGANSGGALAIDQSSLPGLMSDGNVFIGDPTFSFQGNDGPKVKIAGWRQSAGQDRFSVSY